MDRHTGKFYVNREIVDGGRLAEILAIMEFIPYRVEHLYDRDAFEYIGCSPLFDETPKACYAREYVINIMVDEDDALSVSVDYA